MIFDLTECGLIKWMNFHTVSILSKTQRNRSKHHAGQDSVDIRPEKPNVDTETPSASSFSDSSLGLSSSPKIQSVAVTKQPRSGYRHCWGCWAHWKRLPTAMRWLLVIFGLIAVTVVTAWFVGSHLAAKDRIEKERLAKLQIVKPGAENAIHQRALITALPGDSSEISLSTATSSLIVTAPMPIFTDPARNTFRIAMSTNGVASPAPSMGVTRTSLTH